MEDARLIDEIPLKCGNETGLADAWFTEDSDEVRLDRLHVLRLNVG